MHNEQTLPSFAPLTADLGFYPVLPDAQWVERVLQWGVRSVQLRFKPTLGNDADAQLQVRAAVAAGRAVAGAQVFINDHWQLAMAEGAYGVHLGQEDLAHANLGAIRAAGLRLGVSTHACWEVCRAAALRPSYIACGPIHATRLKAMPWTPQGEDNLAHWCELLGTPVVAIGGMDAARARAAMRCGAAGVAVAGAIVGSPTPEAAIAELTKHVAIGRADWARGDRHAAPALPMATLAPMMRQRCTPA